jgi:SAM-dependent methyltransferase
MTNLRSWYEDDAFWSTWGPILFSERRKADAVGQVDRILSLTGFQPKAPVLDLCCGVGRHSLELARRGFRVTGVDRTPEYLKQASEMAKYESLDIEFVHEDMRNFRRSDSFDAVINLFTSFGYFEDANDDRKVIENIYVSLKHRGKCVIDIMSKEILARVFRERDWNEANGIFWLEERKVLYDWSWIESRWILFKDGRLYENKVSHRLYSASELSKLLYESGFAEVKIYGDMDGSPYDHTARRLVAIGYKE